jgi:hypothetical protein
MSESPLNPAVPVYATNPVAASKPCRFHWMVAGLCRMQGVRIPHLSPVGYHRTIVNPLRFLVDAFVNTFGITPPTKQNEVRAGRVIALMLAGVLVFLAAAAWVLRAAFLR